VTNAILNLFQDPMGDSSPRQTRFGMTLGVNFCLLTFEFIHMFDNLSKIKLKLNEQHLDALLITSVPNITYLTGYSHFSKEEREAFVILTKNQQYIVTDARYSEAVKKHVPRFILLEVSPQNRFEQIGRDLVKTYSLKRIGFEEQNITVAEHKKLSKLHDPNHFTTCIPISNLVESIRIIKEPKEIQKIEQSCNLGDKAFEYILKKITLGISELELAFELEFFIKKHGANLSFPSIVAFGPNASIPHHQISEQELNNNEFVLLDFGVLLDDYCSDMTRTVFFGKATDEQKKMYNTVLESQKRAFNLLNTKYLIPNTKTKTIKAKNIDKAARDYIISQGYPSIPHSLGHGIGIEVHESPRLSPISKDELKPGMVFSLEPGIYVPNFGGVRIEDLIVIEPSGPRYLTHASKHLIEI